MTKTEQTSDVNKFKINDLVVYCHKENSDLMEFKNFVNGQEYEVSKLLNEALIGLNNFSDKDGEEKEGINNTIKFYFNKLNTIEQRRFCQICLYFAQEKMKERMEASYMIRKERYYVFNNLFKDLDNIYLDGWNDIQESIFQLFENKGLSGDLSVLFECFNEEVKKVLFKDVKKDYFKSLPRNKKNIYYSLDTVICFFIFFYYESIEKELYFKELAEYLEQGKPEIEKILKYSLKNNNILLPRNLQSLFSYLSGFKLSEFKKHYENVERKGMSGDKDDFIYSFDEGVISPYYINMVEDIVIKKNNEMRKKVLSGHKGLDKYLKNAKIVKKRCTDTLKIIRKKEDIYDNKKLKESEEKLKAISLLEIKEKGIKISIKNLIYHKRFSSIFRGDSELSEEDNIIDNLLTMINKLSNKDLEPEIREDIEAKKKVYETYLIETFFEKDVMVGFKEVKEFNGEHESKNIYFYGQLKTWIQEEKGQVFIYFKSNEFNNKELAYILENVWKAGEGCNETVMAEIQRNRMKQDIVKSNNKAVLRKF